MAKVIAISISEKKGQKKHNIPEAKLITDFGMEGDAHAGKWHRQISLLGIQSIDLMRAKGADVNPGDFAENITIEGIVLYELPVGTRLFVGDEVLLEVTQIGKECHSGCEIQKQVGSCIMPTQGIFAKVLSGGMIHVGDTVVVEESASE
ncbi:MOSC domain-containing protein [Veillonella criceti]|uniref:Molybdenum cofactor biosynthesis protein MoaC /MOSC-domain-containing protein n=1 Tax=Veillonella criceti TaxID=103891 RepID=A0A380NJW3_9FIRM|nr:MOSC domain-containing protein [Veillonella criceti]SUP42761.1 molybdenum cofactor biosynthesis protein MoaC /MOSC-domain-containing protein [Veillonella criceti]